MTRKVIGVDVDLTVADSDVSHWFWLSTISTSDTTYEEDWTSELDYNLGNYFTLPEGVDSMDFWRSEKVYDKFATFNVNGKLFNNREIKPISGSQKALRELKELGYEILFISHIKGNHHKSKVEWLKRYFPFMDGFVATKEKHYVNSSCFAFIDDRNNHINQSKSLFNIKFNTTYQQSEELIPEMVDLVTNDWSQIANFLKERKAIGQ